MQYSLRVYIYICCCIVVCRVVSDITIFYKASVQNSVPFIGHLPRRASWHFFGWLVGWLVGWLFGWLLVGCWISQGLSGFKDLLSILGFLALADLVSMFCFV